MRDAVRDIILVVVFQCDISFPLAIANKFTPRFVVEAVKTQVRRNGKDAAQFTNEYVFVFRRERKSRIRRLSKRGTFVNVATGHSSASARH